MNNEKVPLTRALGIILTSVLCIGSLAAGVILLYDNLKMKHMQHVKYTIAAIAQTCSEPERLKTVYLAELLDLSVDHPTNFYQFDVDKAQLKLEANPLIKFAKVKKIPPNTIYVDYALRKPVAFLGDYTNTAIDEDGYLFPFKPFFTPKSLPEVFVGLASFGNTSDVVDGEHGCWGACLQGHRAQLALKIYSLIQGHSRIVKIDTSKAFSLSYGQRQIVVILEDRIIKEHEGRPILCIYPKILRLSTKAYSQGLANYMTLNEKLLADAKTGAAEAADSKVMHMPAAVIDLRIPNLAFVKTKVD